MAITMVYYNDKPKGKKLLSVIINSNKVKLTLLMLKQVQGKIHFEILLGNIIYIFLSTPISISITWCLIANSIFRKLLKHLLSTAPDLLLVRIWPISNSDCSKRTLNKKTSDQKPNRLNLLSPGSCHNPRSIYFGKGSQVTRGLFIQLRTLRLSHLVLVEFHQKRFLSASLFRKGSNS